MPEVQRQYVRHNSRLSLEEHRQHAQSLLNESERTQEEVADELDVLRTSVAKAVTHTGSRYVKLQTRIIELLSDFEVEKEVRMRYRKPSRTTGEAA